MRHVGSDEVARGQSTAQAEFPGQDTGRDNACELPRIITGLGLVSAADPEQVQAGRLGFEDRATADGANLNRGH